MYIKQRVRALEAVKRVKFTMPLVIIVVDELTDSQKLEIAEAEREGRNVIEIILDMSIKTE